MTAQDRPQIHPAVLAVWVAIGAAMWVGIIHAVRSMW